MEEKKMNVVVNDAFDKEIASAYTAKGWMETKDFKEFKQSIRQM
jgi:hypothetical protein